MSRHRSPGRPTPRVGPRTARPRPAQHRTAAVRHGLTAATLAGGALAVTVPLAVPADTVLALASDADPSTAARAALPEPLGVTPVTDPLPSLRRLTSVVPVEAAREPEPVGFSVAGLLKSVGLADVRERTECDTDLGGLGRVRPWVRDAAQFLACLYGRPDLIGVAGRARHSDHPAGLAVDFMMRGERGDRLAACALANMRALGISYVIWEQRINFGDGWQRMEDRGGDTENHVDHVHISFERRPGLGVPLTIRCR